MKRLTIRVLSMVAAVFSFAMAAPVVAPQPVKAEAVFFGSQQGSCPDPQASRTPSTHSLVLACTSDYSTSVFPLYMPNNHRFSSWHRVANAFPANHQPYWAIPAPIGRYWAPDLHWIDRNWVLYFAAQENRYGNFVIGIAWGRTLQTIWTHTKILHYRGQYNAFNPSYAREKYGAVIDPGEAQDPATGQRYLVWSEQHSSIWGAPLSRNGLAIEGTKVRMLMHSQSPTDCEGGSSCVDEGSALTFHNGLAYLFYSVRSTWDWSYAMRAAWSRRPLSFYHRFRGYILRAGHGWFGPGGGAAPVRVEKKKWVEFYHAMTGNDPAHTSAVRRLMMGSLTWRRVRPVINGGIAG
jgi:Glycosyl hydrolases family 43